MAHLFACLLQALQKNEKESQLQLELKTQLEACEQKKQKLSLEMTGLQKQVSYASLQIANTCR